MSRNELSPEARAELDALERVLAREPIGEEHLELAALVDSVRAQAPRLEPAAAARLDARFAERRGRRLRVRHRARLALAGGGLAAVAAAVALTIVIASGTLETAAGRSHVGARSPATAASKAAASRRFAVPQAPGASAAAGAGGARLVRSSATLELATRAPSLMRVADGVVVMTEREDGTVASSATTMAGAAGRARFSLRVPSGHFELLIAGIVALARVRALTEVTSNITGGYERALSALVRRRSERAGLMRRLARTTGGVPALTLRRRVATIGALIAADARRATALDDEAHTAALEVAVVATPNG